MQECKTTKKKKFVSLDPHLDALRKKKNNQMNTVVDKNEVDVFGEMDVCVTPICFL